MAKRDPGWELYRSFLAVLREGSLSGAARNLGLTQPTVGRHIQELESLLDTTLFTRAQNGLRPTDMGHALKPHAQIMAGAAAALIRASAAKDFEAHAVVRIAASEIVGVEVLPPILTEFRARHPGVVIELSLSDRTEDLLRRDADNRPPRWKRHGGSACTPPLPSRARTAHRYGAIGPTCIDWFRSGNDVNPCIAASRLEARPRQFRIANE